MTRGRSRNEEMERERRKWRRGKTEKDPFLSENLLSKCSLQPKQEAGSWMKKEKGQLGTKP